MCFAAIVALLSSIFAPISVVASESASKVLLVYNANYIIDSDKNGVQDSLQVANYYAAARGIPSNHILGVKATVAEANSYTSFSQLSSEILQPIQAKVNALGATNIDIIVLCYGIPYKLAGTPTVAVDNIISNLAWNLDNRIQIQASNPYYEAAPYFAVNKKGHFSHSLYYFLDSYLHKDPIYLVMRLDGPLGVKGVMDMIDRSLYAEKYVSTKSGYFTGNAYVDSEGIAEPCDYTDSGLDTCSFVKEGDWGDTKGVDANIAFAERYIRNAGLRLKWQVSGDVIGTTGLIFSDGTSAEAAPNALLYSGWYAFNKYEYIAWQWLPGAVGVDYDSSSLAYPIQSPYNLAWAVQALNHGITATCGNVSEPGVGGAHATSVLLYYMLQGYTFAEASELANPYIGASQTMCIGDPLYAPFASKTAVIDQHKPVFTSTPSLTQTTGYGAVVSGIINTSASAPAIASFTLGYGTAKPSSFSKWSQQVVNSGGYTRRFSIEAQNLKPGTTYYYQIQAQSPLPKYNSTLSPIGSFRTPPETTHLSQIVPGTLAISSFDDGEDGVSWHAPEPAQSPGQKIRTDTEFAFDQTGNLLNAYAGQWMNYTISVPDAGKYEIDVVACDCYSASDGSVFHIELDGVNVTGSVLMPNMGRKFGTIVMRKGVSFSEGTHLVRLVMDSGPMTTDTMSQLLTDIGKFQSIIVK